MCVESGRGSGRVVVFTVIVVVLVVVVAVVVVVVVVVVVAIVVVVSPSVGRVVDGCPSGSTRERECGRDGERIGRGCDDWSSDLVGVAGSDEGEGWGG